MTGLVPSILYITTLFHIDPTDQEHPSTLTT